MPALLHRSPPGWLTLTVALLPIITVNLCFQLSVAGDFIPDCFVYVDGCTSISATGRHGIAYWLFKALMLPQCLVLVLFWRAIARHVDTPRAWWLRLTVVASLFLAVYVLALGSEGDLYRMMRRYGVFVFFLGTFIAQIAVTLRHGRSALPTGVLWAQRSLLAVMFLLAIAEVPLGTFGLEDDRGENIIEWNFSLLMQLWLLSWWWVKRPSADASPATAS
ncbi:MAG: hypothetical protein AAF290_07420 [Pseudomonadota bacterium]